MRTFNGVGAASCTADHRRTVQVETGLGVFGERRQLVRMSVFYCSNDGFTVIRRPGIRFMCWMTARDLSVSPVIIRRPSDSRVVKCLQ